MNRLNFKLMFLIGNWIVQVYVSSEEKKKHLGAGWFCLPKYVKEPKFGFNAFITRFDVFLFFFKK